MAKKDTRRPAVKVEATAKAELSAKAIYQRKHTTTEVIPPDVTRAKAVAWLDLISPLTEWAGLKGDELKLRRAQLRLQREDILAEIVEKARQRLDHSAAPRKPISNKFIVPFLEKASLEDEGSLLIDMWSGLLASAAEDGTSHHVHFVSIMSQLSSQQGALLARIVGTSSRQDLHLAMHVIKRLETHSIKETIVETLQEAPAESLLDLGKLASRLTKLFDILGVVVIYADVKIGPRSNFVEVDLPRDSIYSDGIEVDFSILEAVGLVKRVEAIVEADRACGAFAIYYHLTAMGYHFACACQIVSGDIVYRF